MSFQEYYDVIITIEKILDLLDGSSAFTETCQKLNIPEFEDDFKKWYNCFGLIYDKLIQTTYYDEIIETLEEDDAIWFIKYCNSRK